MVGISKWGSPRQKLIGSLKPPSAKLHVFLRPLLDSLPESNDSGFVGIGDKDPGFNNDDEETSVKRDKKNQVHIIDLNLVSSLHVEESIPIHKFATFSEEIIPDLSMEQDFPVLPGGKPTTSFYHEKKIYLAFLIEHIANILSKKPINEPHAGWAVIARDDAVLMSGKVDSELEWELSNITTYRDAKVSEFLSGFIKQGQVVDPSELARFSIHGDSPEYGPSGFGANFGDNAHNRGFYDCRYVFCLLRDSVPIAQVSFNAMAGGIFIRQIQARNKIANIKWERALVAYVENFAREHGLNCVAIQSAKHNTWHQIKSTSDPGGHGHMLYDVTAKRSGFKEEPNTGNYIKVLRYPADSQKAVQEPLSA